jgi:FkbH-like protein
MLRLFKFLKPDRWIPGFVSDLYRYVLERAPDADGHRHHCEALRSGRVSPGKVLNDFFTSEERQELEIKKGYRGAVNPAYHAPETLRVDHDVPGRIALIGTCLVESWQHELSQFTSVDYFQVNNVLALPRDMPRAPGEYGFQIIQLRLRNIFSEVRYLNLEYSDLASYEALFEEACENLARMLHGDLRWNIEHGLLSFVCNYFVPQQNLLGRLLPRNDLRNLGYFISKLNERIAQEVAAYRNVYVLDLDQLASIYGKKYIVDDVVHITTHEALVGDYDFLLDQSRIAPVGRFSSIHKFRETEFIASIWLEALAMYRTVRQRDAVKLVITDLDDTLWRGVLAEGALEEYEESIYEGWPVGVMEALVTLKQRGVLLAIASKNDLSKIEELWPRATRNLIRLSDFSTVKINWKPKVENIAEILREVNVLPKNVLFIDDNPAERAAVRQAYPEMRIIGENPYLVRQTLLWSAETQVATITDESSRRTEMVQAQVRREGDRKTKSREEFLRSLGVKLRLGAVKSVDDPHFARAFELINKTNQFNTTGKRWTHDEMLALFRADGELRTFTVSDAYSNYGLVGVVVVQGATIRQWAMSCRVIGLDVELAALAEIQRGIGARGHLEAQAQVVETDVNYLCRDLFARGGFVFDGAVWRKSLAAETGSAMAHVEIMP